MPQTIYSGHEVLALVLDEANKRLRVDASLNVDQLKVENMQLETHIEANPDAGEDADSVIIAGTTDGLFPGLGPNTTTRPLRIDTDGHLQIDILTSALPAGASTEATLSTRASEATLSTRASEATLATLLKEATFTAEDFATQATLATRASEATLATLGTEATLSSLNTKVLSEPDTAVRVMTAPASISSTSAVAVGIVATQLVAANALRRGLLVFNNGADTIFLGIASVTTLTGIPLPVGASILLDLPARFTGALFAIGSVAQVSPNDTRVMEMV